MGGHWWLKDGSESALMMVTESHNDTDMTDLSMTNKLAVGVQSEKNTFFGVFQVCVTVCLWSEYAPGTPRDVGKKITWYPILWLTV